MRFTQDDIDRFLLRVTQCSNGCWAWNGPVQSRGYGILACSVARRMLAHRFSYMHFVGDIAQGMQVCHKCDNPTCVNPNHLFLGTHRDNMADMVQKKRSARGERTAGAKLTEVQVKEIKQALAQGNVTSRELARQYGIGDSLIDKIRQGRAWKWISI